MKRSHHSSSSKILALAFGLSAAACGSNDPAGDGGSGKIAFTTWGEEYIQDEIPADSGEGSGFVDGWTVKYTKFLVNFKNIKVADSSGATAAAFEDSKLFDNHVSDPGVKSIVDFDDVSAKAWDRVSYQIVPVTDDTTLDGSATSADKQLMLDGGYSLYVEASASKDEVTKHYAWGFTVATQYNECHSEQDGKEEDGIVVKNNSTVTVELTTHGDHLYYDRLQESPDPAVKTSLRFDDLAAADKDDDGEVTLEELNAAPLDVKRYNPSGLEAYTQGALVTSLARTVGHFRGEGECSISANDAD